MDTTSPTFANRTVGVCAILLSALALAACHREPTAASTEHAQAAAAQITAEYLRERIAEFSADEFEGRAPATPADARARAYLIEHLQRIGFEPAGPNGTWEQPFDVIGVTAKMPQQWVFERNGKSISFEWWNDFIAASGTQRERGAVKDAEVVFVGYGIQAPEYDWDDFKGQDLKGKVFLMLNNDPDWDPDLFGGDARLYYGRWTYKYESAARQGAVGAIIIHTTPSAGYPFQVVQTSWSGEQVELPVEEESSLVLKSWLTEDAARRLVSFAGKSLDELVAAARSKDFAPVPLGVRTSLAFENTIKRSSTANVYGLLRGSDPDLKDEYVIYTAHFDHLGIGEPNEAGDRIYNGAMDNASGVAQVLAIGKAFKALPTPPRRSIMLLFVAAEEQGLLGSKYFAANPTVPPGKIAANINFDSANIWGRTKDVVLIGKGKSTLDAVVEDVARMQGRVVTGDPFPDRGSFYRSDQFSFAQIGVPAVYAKSGVDFIGKPAGWGQEQLEIYTREHYHQPSDELGPDWNFEGMIEDAQLGFFVGLLVANADELPSWNPGDEFEAARKRALEALERVE